MAKANPCDRAPDKKRKLDGGITLHTYLDVPNAEAPPLIMCRRKDTNYWDDDVAVGSTPKVCTVLIYYKKS